MSVQCIQADVHVLIAEQIQVWLGLVQRYTVQPVFTV